MADSPPPSNSSRLLTPALLPSLGLRQVSEVSELEPEPERDACLTIAVPPTSGNPDDNKSKNEDGKRLTASTDEPTGSQLTSSDKLSTLPSHVRSPLAGRPAVAGTRPNGSNSGSAEGTPSELPLSTATTPETRFAQLSGSARQRQSPRLNDHPLPTPTPSETILPSGRRTTFGSCIASPVRRVVIHFSPRPRHKSLEEPFIPIDPFQLRDSLSLNPFARCFGARRLPVDEEEASSRSDEHALDQAPYSTCACASLLGSSCFRNVHTLGFDTFLRQLYLHTQLRLPSLYFLRVKHIFKDSGVYQTEIQQIIDAREGVETENVQDRTRTIKSLFPEEWVPGNVSPALVRFKQSWESLVDSLVREWKTLNVLSALLLTAILTLFQIPDVAGDPLTRTVALCSLVSSLMSLAYGIIYIIRFGNMRSMYHASRWAEESQQSETAIFWNVWVLLALPGIWLAWSVLGFIVAITSFVWRTGARSESQQALSHTQEYGPRVAITCQLLLGLVYFAFVIRTFRRYGENRPIALVSRSADVRNELETRELEREGAAGLGRTPARENEPEELAMDSSGSGRLATNDKANELGLSGMDSKQEITIIEYGDVPTVGDSVSFGM